MKKLIAIILSVLTLAVIGGCEKIKDVELNLYAPDGAPGIAVTKIINDGRLGGKEVNANIVAGAEPLGAAILNGSATMAVLPLNLAAKFYNNGVDIKLVSVNVFGSLYMVGKTPITGVNDLVGKVVHNIGRGGTPDVTLKYILQENGIEYVESETAVAGKVALQYVAAAGELVQLLAAGNAQYGILGEPAVTNCNKKTGTTTVLDIQAEWKKVTGESYTQAGFVVSGDVADDAVVMSALKKALAENADWCVNNASMVKDILVGKGSSLQMDYSAELISRCNVGYKSAAEARNDVEKYFNVLLSFDQSLIGGKLPAKDFYL